MMIRRVSLALAFGFLVSSSLCGVATAQEKEHKEHKSEHKDHGEHHDEHGEHQAKEIAWFDMEHCEICKNMASMKDSIHKIDWEIHFLDNGMLSVSSVPDDMKEAMAKAEANIEKTVSRLQQGQELAMCGYCMNYGKLMALGANFKKLKTVGVEISLVTSDDPKVVKEIHAMGKKAKIEHEKMFKNTKTEAKLKKDR